MTARQLTLDLTAACAPTRDAPRELPPATSITAQRDAALHRMTSDELEAFRRKQASLYAHLPRSSQILDTRWGLQRRR